MRTLLSLSVAFLPFVAQAAGVDLLLMDATYFLNRVGPFLVTLAVVAFIWGLVKFIAKAGDEKAKAEGKNLMVWGTIALFCIVSFWSIIGMIQRTLRVDYQVPTAVRAPTIPKVYGY